MTQEDLDLAFSDLAKSHKLVCEALDRVQNRSTEQLLEYRQVKRKLEIAISALEQIEDPKNPCRKESIASDALAEIEDSR
jgi:hypothetical protein